MKRKSKIALGAGGLAAAAAASFVFVMGLPASTPVLAQLKIGQPAPDFRLNDVDGRPVSLADFRGKTVVLEWHNPECPTVKEKYGSGEMQRTQAAAAAEGTSWLTINSSAKWKQGHMTPAKAKRYVASQESRRTAYLLDPEGTVGRAYGARATPHMYVVNASGKLVYNGGLDGSASGGPGQGASANLVMAALRDVKAGKPVSVPTSRAYGCAVKY